MSKLSRDLRATKNQVKQNKIKRKIESRITSIKNKIEDLNWEIKKISHQIEEKKKEKQEHNKYEKKIKGLVKKLVDEYSKMESEYICKENVEILKKDGCIAGIVDDFYFISDENGELLFYETIKCEEDYLSNGLGYSYRYHYSGEYNSIKIKLSPFGCKIEDQTRWYMNFGNFYFKMPFDLLIKEKSSVHNDIEKKLETYRNINKK